MEKRIQEKDKSCTERLQEQSKNNLKKNPEIKTKENEEEQPTIKILKKGEEK